ncbi:phosphate system positive regulatory protein [Salix suchowensis]|nr:phosphate system positive regulatory protein [Salix suchowensis]
MARASNKPSDALPRTPSKKKTPSKTKDATQNAQLMTPAQDTPGPSTNSLLAQTVLTTDQWYRSRSTKNGYANYVKAGKKWLAEWVEQNTGESSPAGEQGIESEASKLAGAFDVIKEETPLALRLLIAFKCEHQQRGFSTAEGIRAAFKDYFSRVLLCQGDFWKLNEGKQKWEGNPVFQSDFKVYFESLKNRQNRTATVVQALPMLPADMKVLMDYLDTSEASKNIAEVRRLCWKAFATTSFCLWTRNEELINFKYGDVRMCQESAAGELYHEFDIVFRKTNKDPTKGMIK